MIKSIFVFLKKGHDPKFCNFIVIKVLLNKSVLRSDKIKPVPEPTCGFAYWVPFYVTSFLDKINQIGIEFLIQFKMSF